MRVVQRGPEAKGGPEIRVGSRMAKLFRQSRRLTDVRACDLTVILEEDEIDVIESEADDPGYTASLIRFDSDKGGGIVLARGQADGRRRFSIAHELAHFHIPAHHDSHSEARCNERDMRIRGHDAARREWEANDFAAELLMPQRLFAEDAKHRELSIEGVDGLASSTMYNVSRLAAAWRLVQVTRERAALVVSTNGRIEWVVRSSTFATWLTDRGQELRPDTLAAASFRGEGTSGQPLEVPAAAWFDDPAAARGILLESTYAIEQQGQVVSLLWQPERDDRND